MVVDRMWRLEPATTSTMASRSPWAARGSRWSPLRMMMAALTDTPTEPITPTTALIPKGKPNSASGRRLSPAESPATATTTPARRSESKVSTTVASPASATSGSDAARSRSVSARASASPPHSRR